MSDEAFTLEVKGLDQLLKALKARPPVARIGILGDNPRNKAPAEVSYETVSRMKVSPKGASSHAPTNAEVGAAHEFGTTSLPQRSFLRIPLSDHLEKEMERTGELDKDVLANVVKQGSVLPWLEKIAILGEGIVAGAFESGGYGKWAPWKKGYSNNTGDVLVDTQQLRNSITSEVKE